MADVSISEESNKLQPTTCELNVVKEEQTRRIRKTMQFIVTNRAPEYINAAKASPRMLKAIEGYINDRRNNKDIKKRIRHGSLYVIQSEKEKQDLIDSGLIREDDPIDVASLGKVITHESVKD